MLPAAAMTLTDDNFASIVAAVQEGRGTFGKIKKYLMFLLSSNIAEIGLMGGTTLLGLALIVYVPFLHEPFGTFALPVVDWAVVLLGAATISPVLEFTKWLRRRGWCGNTD